MKVLHIITGLRTGGAEMMLAKLVSHPCLAPSTIAVVSLIKRGPIADLIEAQGVRVHCLGMALGTGGGSAPWKLGRIVRAQPPDVIQGWMYHGNLAALAARAFLPAPVPVAWNIRQSLYSITDEKRLTRSTIRWNARLSRRAQAIIYNTPSSAHQHNAIGFDSQHAVIIPNGFDVHLFQPDTEVRSQIRAQLGYGSNIPIVGMFARYHPMKDHRTFLEAVRLVVAERPNLRVIMVGRGVDASNENLMRWLRAFNLEPYVQLLGERMDVAHLMQAVDVCALSSAWGEGFPNVLGEAMACGVPCVTTDIGGSADIVGDTGVVVSPRDPQALAAGITSLIAHGSTAFLGKKARARIIERFAIESVAQQYAGLYRGLQNDNGRDGI